MRINWPDEKLGSADHAEGRTIAQGPGLTKRKVKRLKNEGVLCG